MRRSFLTILLLVAACASEPDPQDIEGIGRTEDGVFRTLALEQVPPSRAYAVARAVIRLRFAGGAVLEDPLTRTIELERNSNREPVRFRLFLRVVPEGDGSVVEIFCPVDAIRESPDEAPADPWEFLGKRFAQLENDVLHAIWDELMVRPLGG